jgi:phosphoglycolate phosphatase-like HAD superfamily hydrolase
MPAEPRVYALLFDIDGTLVHTGGAGQLAFAETFAQDFGVPEISSAVAFAGRSDRAIAMDLLKVHGLAASDENWRRFRIGYLRRLPDALKRRQGRVLPGVGALLDALSGLKHTAIGLLTGNLREGAEKKLGYYGLWSHFAFGGFGDDTNNRCEIAAIAVAEAERYATEQNGASSPRLAGVMVIGDTVHDIRCARSIGAVAVAAPTGGSSRDELAAAAPDILLDDLSDPRRLLQLVHAANR